MAASINKLAISMVLNVLCLVIFAQFLDPVSTLYLLRQFQCTSIYISYTYDNCLAKFLTEACWHGLEGSGIIGDCPSICNNLSDSDEGRCRDKCPEYYKTCIWVSIASTPVSSPGHITTTQPPGTTTGAIVGYVCAAALPLFMIFAGILYCQREKKLCFVSSNLQDEKMNSKEVEKGIAGSDKGENIKEPATRTNSTVSVSQSVEVSSENGDDDVSLVSAGADYQPLAAEPPPSDSPNGQVEQPDPPVGQKCTGTNDPEGTPNEANIDTFPDNGSNIEPMADRANESGYTSGNLSRSSSFGFTPGPQEPVITQSGLPQSGLSPSGAPLSNVAAASFLKGAPTKIYNTGSKTAICELTLELEKLKNGQQVYKAKELSDASIGNSESS